MARARLDYLSWDRKRERFEAMLRATGREYDLWMQAADQKYRLLRSTVTSEYDSLRRQRIYNAMSRRIERRQVAWERAKINFYFGPEQETA